MSAVLPQNFSAADFEPPRTAPHSASKSAPQLPSVASLRASKPQLRSPGAKRGPGLLIVIGLHVLLAWALASGLARKAVEIIKKPIEMAVIQDLPPPPPPPPKIVKLKEIPRDTPPPPAYVPPAEVVTNPAPAPVITQTQAEPPKAPVEIAPPAPPAPPAPVAKPEPVKQDIKLACPGYQATIAQALEDAFDRVGIVGTVRTLIKLRGNQIVDVQAQSGPQAYFKYLAPAIKRIKCASQGADEVHVVLDVNFAR